MQISCNRGFRRLHTTLSVCVCAMLDKTGRVEKASFSSKTEKGEDRAESCWHWNLYAKTMCVWRLRRLGWSLFYFILSVDSFLIVASAGFWLCQFLISNRERERERERERQKRNSTNWLGGIGGGYREVFALSLSLFIFSFNSIERERERRQKKKESKVK